MARDRDLRAGRPMATAQRRTSEFENGCYRDENEGSERVSPATSQGAGPMGLVRRKPLAAVITGFGAGLGFGLAVTLLITRRQPSWYERNIAAPLQHLPQGLRHVPDSLSSYVPASWKHW